MNGKHVSLCSKAELLIKNKVVAVFMAVMLMFMMVPSGLVFATSLDNGTDQNAQATEVAKEAEATEEEAAEEAEEISEIAIEGEEIVSPEVSNQTTESSESSEKQPAVNEPANLTQISGVLKNSDGSLISGELNPYVFLAGWKSDLAFVKIDATLDNVTGKYSVKGIPADFVAGIVTAGASHHTNQGTPVFATEEHSVVNFNLKPGANCSFVEDGNLNNYVVKQGSYLQTTYTEKISLPSDINIGNIIPTVGVQNGSVFTAKLSSGTITYDYGYEGEFLHLVLGAAPKSEKTFSHWTINDNLAYGAYTVDLTKVQDIKIQPHFCSQGNMDVGGTVKNEKGEVIENAYAMVIGYDLYANGKIFISDMAFTDSNGNFKLEIPKSIIGIIYVGASQCTNQIHFIWDGQQVTNFILKPGSQCSIDMSQGCKTVLIKAGSKLHDDTTHIDYTLDSDIDAGDWFPPVGLPFDSTITFNSDGTVVYKYSRQNPPENAEPAQNVEIILQAVGEEGRTFQGWQKNGEAFAGEYKPNEGDGDFSISPVFASVTPQEPEVAETKTAQTGDSTGNVIAILAIVALASLGTLTLRRKISVK